MEIDPTKLYQMPLVMGPLYEKETLPRIPYPDIENFAFQFKTAPELARKLIPDCYEIDNEPIVTILFGYYKGFDFLAGGGYNVAAVQISANFKGQRDEVEGDCFLVMFENQTRPILGGREFLGVPKIYADIPEFKVMPNGSLRCEASLWGHLLFGIEVPKMRTQNPIVKTIASKRINSRPWLGYKYIPALDGPPDADYPTATRNDVKIQTLWMGKEAMLYFGSADFDDIGYTYQVIEAIKSLPVRNIVQVIRFQGSAVLRFDQSHRLR